MSQPALPDSSLSTSGVGLAVACYGLWGLVPVYWKGIAEISALEALIPRILWTFVLLFLVARATGRSAENWERGGGEWGWTGLAAVLLAFNWGLFVYAVQSDQVVASSLGYYINPLVSILLGMLILGERLNRLQALAVGAAAMGVAVLAIRAESLPWISLALAFSFGFYGLIHKLHPQPALAGLTREMMLLSPIALVAFGLLFENGDSGLIRATPGEQAYLAFSGVVTAVPLLLFHAATRRLPLFAVGMFQYIAPTMTLLLAVFLYREPFGSAQASGFAFVWLGLALFSFDSVRRARG